jgi:hypothetical protein
MGRVLWARGLAAMKRIRAKRANMSTEMRVRFEVVNLPIRQPLRVAQFEISPREGIEQRLKRLQGFMPDTEVTADGIYAVHGAPSPASAFEAFRQDMRALELLLTFAHRCHVQAINPCVEVFDRNEWRFAYWGTYLEFPGRANAAPWYGHQLELASFLGRAYPQLRNEAFVKDTRLLLALSLYDQALGELRLEIEYLKRWMALEILVGDYRQSSSPPPLEQKLFDAAVRPRLRSVLKELNDEGRITTGQEKWLAGQVKGLNSPSRSRDAHDIKAFLDSVFMSYPAQQIDLLEINRFFQIRNAIVHRGWMDLDADDVGTELGEESGRLRSLLERVILARLGESPNLMNFSWRKYLPAR